MNTRLYVFCLALGQIFFSQSFGQQEDQNCLYIGTYNDTKEVLEKGLPIDQTVLAYRYLRGVCGETQDIRKALYMLEKQELYHYLGDLYKDGDVVKQDYTKAIQWYKKSIERDFGFGDDSAHILGDIYLYGKGVPKDFDKSVNMYCKYTSEYLASNHDSERQLGKIYLIPGIDEYYVNAEAKTSISWYCGLDGENKAFLPVNNKALDPDNSDYPDVFERIEMYEIASERGDAVAQYHLGLMYQEGDGVLRNYAKSAELMKESSYQGFPLAQEELGRMYQKGMGLKKSDVMAYVWFSIASSKGVFHARMSMDRLEEKMNKNDLDSAQEKADVCIRSKYKSCF